MTVDVVLALLDSAVTQGKIALSSAESRKYQSAFAISITLAKELNKGIFSNSMDVFREEWQRYQEFAAERRKRHAQVLGEAALLCGMQDDPGIRMSEYLNFPLGKSDTARAYLRVYMTLRQTFGKLFDPRPAAGKSQEPFPLGEELKEAAPGTLTVISEAKRLVSCTQLVGKENLPRYTI